MEDYVVQLLATTKEKFSSSFIGFWTGFWITGSVFFFFLSFTIYFPCLLLYTWDTPPPQRRAQQPLHLRGKTHYNDCWVAAGQQAIEELKAWNQTQINQSPSNIVQRAAWWLCLCSRVQNKEEGQSWKQRSKQSQKVM